MNMILRRELKRNLKGFIATGIICSFMAAYMISMSESFGEDIQQLINIKFSKGLQAAFGMQGLDYGRANSFFAMCFSYLYLFISIYASTIFSTIVSKEYSEKTAEFLFSLPAKRINLIISKLSVALFYTAMIVTVVFVSSWLSFEINTGETYDLKPVMLMSLAWLIGSVTFGSAAFLLSSFFTRTRTVTSLSAGLVLVLYILQVVISVNKNLAFLKYISPFDWFKGSEIDATGRLPLNYCIIAVAVSALLFLAGTRRFRKMDVLI